MKSIQPLISALFLIVILLYSQISYSQITTEEDEFTGKVTVTSDFFTVDVEDGADVSQANGMFIYSGPSYLFAVATISDGWQHLSDDEMNFLIDGERKTYKVAHKESDTNTSGSTFSLTEINGIILNEGEFEKFKEAKEIRFKFGRNVYKISDTGLRYANMLYNEVKK